MTLRAGEIITIPSPIDVHAHLREPGGEDKETIESGTRAALFGGYQAVFDMPNNPNEPTHCRFRMEEKIWLAKRAHTNIGFYAGVDLENPDVDQLRDMHRLAAGLKLYMGHTTGNTKEHNLETARPAIDVWVEKSASKGQQPPVLLHAREEVGAETIKYIAGLGHKVHWCHVSTHTEAESLARLRKAYGEDLVTGGVTPHHLTMTEKDADMKYGWLGARMMPPLGKEFDSEVLLDHLNNGTISIIETDHAPHTASDKFQAETENPTGRDDVEDTTCFGISGIEFVLPVMMSLVARRKISLNTLVRSMHDEPARMLGLVASNVAANTEIAVGPRIIGEDERRSQSRNHPYVGWTAWGQVNKVTGSNLRTNLHRTATRSLTRTHHNRATKILRVDGEV